MPRNTSGSYTPTGTPFVKDTVIDSGVMNTKLGDIGQALTDSLDRNGKGGMSAPLRVPNGTVAAPSLSFTNETGSGVYRAAAGDIRLAVGGVDAVKVSAAGVELPAGGLALTKAAADQAIAKTGGKLNVGTSDANELHFFTEGTDAFYVQKPADGGNVVLTTGNTTITNLRAPEADTDAATKAYADGRSYVVAGRISGAGAILRQTGSVTVTVSRSSAGVYVVAVPGLTENGIVLLTSDPQAVGAGDSKVCSAFVGSSAGEFTILCSVNGGTYADSVINFVVVAL